MFERTDEVLVICASATRQCREVAAAAVAAAAVVADIFRGDISARNAVMNFYANSRHCMFGYEGFSSKSYSIGAVEHSEMRSENW